MIVNIRFYASLQQVSQWLHTTLQYYDCVPSIYVRTLNIVWLHYYYKASGISGHFPGTIPSTLIHIQQGIRFLICTYKVSKLHRPSTCFVKAQHVPYSLWLEQKSETRRQGRAQNETTQTFASAVENAEMERKIHVNTTTTCIHM